jgi:ketosteroid isomerase-like protein
MASVESLLLFSKAWDDAMIRNDAVEIGRFMSDDWVIIGTEGGITPKSAFMRSIESGDLLHTRMDAADFRVRVYGDSGVLTSRGTSSGTYKGQSFSYFEWSTSVFLWKNDSWSCVLTMLTPAASK